MTDPIDRRRLDALLEAALERTGEQRRAFLDRECETGELRAALDRLLAASEGETVVGGLGGALWRELSAERSASSPAPPGAAPLGAGDRVDAYRIVAELGRGGMAVVYLAERADGQYQQKVALKILERPATDEYAVRRFHRERQILASLEHPGIARILGGGIAPDGRPYFALEHVEGARIDRWCDDRRLGVRARLELFAEVARAVAAAHRQLVVHRDLKPANILVGRDGAPKLLDFGIAKLLEDDAAGAAGGELTRAAVPMTPGWASPEQAAGQPVTPASDVYQLGLLLFELLAGERAFAFPGSTPSELTARGPGRAPTRPSAAVAPPEGEERARRRGCRSARQLRKLLAGDLDTIVLTALRPLPERRYESASRLVEDVERYLAGRPILARPDSWGYRARKFALRNRWAVAASAAGLAAVVALSAVYAVRLRAERDLARREAEKARQVSQFLADLFKASDPFVARRVANLTARQLLDEGARRLSDAADPALAGQPEVTASLLHTVGSVYRGLGALDAAVAHLDRAIELRASALGADHPDTLASRRLRMEVERLAGRPRESLAMARDLLPRIVAAHGAGSPEATGVGAHLAFAALQLGETAEAEAAIERAVAVENARVPADPQSLSRALQVQALVLSRLGQPERAVEVARRSIEVLGAVDPTAPSIANTLGNLALDLQNLGRVREAREAYAEALRLVEQRLGGEHPQVALLLLASASLEIAVGETDRGLRLLERGLPMAERLLGPGHPSTGTGRLRRAKAFHDLGRFEEALAEGREARELIARAHSEQAELTIDSDRFVATLLLGAGRLDEARELLLRTVARAEALPPGNVTLPNAWQVLADVHLAQGAAAAAEAAARRTLELEEKLWPEGHPDMANAWRALAEARFAQGDPGGAREALARAETLVAGSEAIAPADLRRIREVAGRLGVGG